MIWIFASTVLLLMVYNRAFRLVGFSLAGLLALVVLTIMVRSL